MSFDRRAQAYSRFLVDAKTWWMTEMFGALREEYEALSSSQTAQTPEDVAKLLEGNVTYPYFAWLERHIQKIKYAGRYGLLDAAEQERDLIESRLEAVNEAALTLNPEIVVPDYYSCIDTHQHPGNLVGDTLAGVVYRLSAMSTQPGSTSGLSLHVRVADLIGNEGRFNKILDLGCGFGKSTLPLAQKFRDAEVVGLDLSAPCLRLAAVEASAAQQQNLRYLQADAVHTEFPSARFDLVTSTMLLHEMPPLVVEEMLAETFRVLQPGGMSIHLDFQERDPFLRFVHHGHGRRNNEPYMEAFDRMDIVEVQERLGFEAVRIEKFAEADGVMAPEFRSWRLPWTVFIARKPLTAPS